MNKINLNLDHCFGITKLSQELTFDGENAVLIYASNGLMKTSFAKTLQLYGQGKTDKVKDVVADIAGSIDIKDEHGNVILPASIYVSNCEEPDSETPKNITSFLSDSVLKQQYDDILKNLSEKQKALFKDISDYARSTDIVSEFVRTILAHRNILPLNKVAVEGISPTNTIVGNNKELKDMATKRISTALLSIFISVVAFAADKNLEKDITMVSYEQGWLDSSGTLALKNNSSEEVKNVVFLITYLDMSGKELDYEEFSKRVSIAFGGIEAITSLNFSFVIYHPIFSFAFSTD